VEDVGALVTAARVERDIDRAQPVRDEGDVAQEVHWGGRLQRAVVRALFDDDGTPLLRAETLIATDGLVAGMQRHVGLLQGLARQIPGGVEGVRDQSAMIDRDLSWLHRVAIGAVTMDDAITV